MPGLRSIRVRIIAAFSLLILLLIGISLLSVFRSGNDQVDIDTSAIETASSTAAALSDIDVEFTLQIETLRAFPISQDWSFAEAFRDSIARVEASIQEAQALQSDPADSQALAALDGLAREVEQMSIQGEGVFLFTEVGDAEQATAARSRVETSVANLRPIVAELISEQQRQMGLALPSTVRTSRWKPHGMALP